MSVDAKVVGGIEAVSPVLSDIASISNVNRCQTSAIYPLALGLLLFWYELTSF
jgi:hypothetical protein